MPFALVSVLATLAVAPAVPAGTVSESKFLEAVARDPRVEALLDEPLALARAERARSGALANPEVSFDRENVSGQARQDTWSLSWAPPLDGRHWLRDRAGRAGHEAAERRRELERIELRARLRETYAGWALAHEGAALGRQLAGIADRLARQSGARAEQGEASALTARRLLLARVEIRAEAARLESELAHALGEARGWVADLPAGALPERPPLPPVPADTSLWAGSPHLAALESDLRRAEALAAAAGRFWPLPEFSVGRRSLAGLAPSGEGPVYGVSWGIPVFDRARGDRIEARARLAAVSARRDLDRTRARERFTAALHAFAALREAAVLAADAGPAAERALSGAVAMFDAGESDVTDLLETLRGVLGGRMAAIQSYGAALRAHRELERAAGRVLPLAEGDE